MVWTHGTYTTWDRLRTSYHQQLEAPFWAAFSPFHSPPQMEEPVAQEIQSLFIYL